MLHIMSASKEVITCFRPQQGLSIMNNGIGGSDVGAVLGLFPSPTGVKYYEYKIQITGVIKEDSIVSVPNRG